MRLSVKAVRFVLIASCLLILSPYTMASAATIEQSKSGGEFGDFELYYDCPQVVSFYVNVTRSGSQTLLRYYRYHDIDGASSGYGLIPNGDFTGNLQTGMTLNTDLSQITGGAVGPISVTWTPLPYSESNEMTGVTEWLKDGFATRTSGVQQWSLAKITGSVCSHTFEHYDGHMGLNEDVSIMFEKKAPTP